MLLNRISPLPGIKCLTAKSEQQASTESHDCREVKNLLFAPVPSAD